MQYNFKMRVMKLILCGIKCELSNKLIPCNYVSLY